MKTMLKKELRKEDTIKKLQESPNNKILIVAHSYLLRALTASGVAEKPGGGENKDGFIGSQTFLNAEVFPYRIDKVEFKEDVEEAAEENKAKEATDETEEKVGFYDCYYRFEEGKNDPD